MIGEISHPKKGSPQYEEEGDVSAKILKPIHFDYPIYQNYLKPKDFNSDRSDWMYVFGQYGMDEITLDRFLFLLNKGTGKNYHHDEETNEIKTKAHHKVIDHNFSVPDSECKTAKTRGKYQTFFRNSLILPNYRYTCAITGIQTPSLLTAAHIVPWAKNHDIRLDPQNGICLSKLVDKCFEDRLIYIDHNYKVQINTKIENDKKLLDYLRPFEGKKISLPVNKDQQPNIKFLEIHRDGI
tara:strand:+ start:267 stop:983 length:717 start_codon:yes stop_codon:yes gene_type:complete